MTEPEEPKKTAKAARRVVAPKIPGYHIQSIIGRGSTGTVYRARQENVDREVALKVLHKELASRPRMVQRLQREARTTARLAHPHIVSAIDMGRTGEMWWFAMELVDGPSLALKLRQEGRLAEREALRLFIPLCEALVHIWENGVVHRDIKPANILIDKVSGARLADLGLAFAGNDPHLTGSEGTLGTPHYISPEQARDPSSVDIRTDIWSFGATLFHAVCGEPPLRGANVAEVLSGVLYGRIPDPADLEPDLSRGLSLVLRKCLSRDFEKRYQTPRELLRDLERVRERRKPKVRAASLEPTSGNNNRVVRTLFVAGLLSVVGIGALLLWKRPWESVDDYQMYGPLQELVQELERHTTPPGVILARLEQLRPELPTQDLSAWREHLKTTRQELNRVLDVVASETTTTFSTALEDKQFGRAERALGLDLIDLMVKRAGVPLSEAPTEFRLEIQSLEQRLGRAVTTAENALREKLLKAFEDDFQVEVDGLIEAGRWRAAADRLNIGAMGLPVLLNVDLSTLPKAREDAMLELLERRLDLARNELNRRWGMLDDELVRWIDIAAGDLGDELNAELEAINAGARLRDGFEQELARRGIAREELLNEPAGLARQRLAEEVAALEEYEKRLVGERETGDLDVLESLAAWLDASVAGTAFRDRRYEELQMYWLGRQEWLNKNPLKMAPWWIELEEHVSARLTEINLLLDLRSRAADELSALNGQTTEMHMTSEVRAEGRLAVQNSGPTATLSFVVGTDREYEMFLAAPPSGLPQGAQLLNPNDVLRLGTQTMAPAQAVAARALFLFREGDTSNAQAALRAVDPMSPYGSIAAEHLRGIERQRSVMSEIAVRRQSQARSLLASLYFDEPDRMARLERDPTRALTNIGRLLSEFGDVELVASKASELKNLERQLRSPRAVVTQADVESVFGAGNVKLPKQGGVELSLDFAKVEVVGVDRGDWEPDGAGWLSPGDIASDDDLFQRDNPRWVLRPPFDSDSGLVVVEFDFFEPSSTGIERLVVFSALGFDVVVQTEASGKQSKFDAGVKGADHLLEDLRSGGGTSRDEGLLRPGMEHTLRMEVEKRRGRLRVLLDGEELLDRALTSPLGRPGSYGVTLVAREQIRLLELRAKSAQTP